MQHASQLQQQQQQQQNGPHGHQPGSQHQQQQQQQQQQQNGPHGHQPGSQQQHQHQNGPLTHQHMGDGANSPVHAPIPK